MSQNQINNKYSSRTREIVEQLNVIDDPLFRKMAEDVGFCEEVLSTILGKNIKVIKTVDQQDIKNLQGRSVILDALCQDDTGKQYDIEVQQADNDDHQRRVRYYASCITANVARTGTDFKDIPDVVIVFISRFDIFNLGKTTYHIKRVIEETGTEIDNGLSEIYVNSAVKDGSDVSELMEIFTQTDKYDFHKFPQISARKEQFKKTEKGTEDMCTLVEEYARDLRAEGKAEGKAEGMIEGKAETLVEMVNNCSKSLNLSIEQACAVLGITIENYMSAKGTK